MDVQVGLLLLVTFSKKSIWFQVFLLFKSFNLNLFNSLIRFIVMFQPDIDECSFGTASCPPNSVCVNVPGTYFCSCKQGFSSSTSDNELGFLCTDVDECGGWGSGHDCPSGMNCKNTDGGYQCVCDNPNNCSNGEHTMSRFYIIPKK